MTTIEITIVEVAGEIWRTEIHDSLLTDLTDLEAALAGELAVVHPTVYNDEWQAGDPLPTLCGATVYAGDECLYTLTDAVPVGTAMVEQRLPNDAAGFLIRACNRDGEPLTITAWYEHEPSSEIVARHTGAFGGLIERLSDGARNYGHGWW